MKSKMLAIDPMRTKEIFCWFCDMFGRCAITTEEWNLKTSKATTMSSEDINIWEILSRSDIAFLVLKLKSNYDGWAAEAEKDAEKNAGGDDGTGSLDSGEKEGKGMKERKISDYLNIDEQLKERIEVLREEYRKAFSEHIAKVWEEKDKEGGAQRKSVKESSVLIIDGRPRIELNTEFL